VCDWENKCEKNNVYNVSENQLCLLIIQNYRECQTITKMYCVIRPDWFVIENRKQNLEDKQMYLKWRALFACRILDKTCGFSMCSLDKNPVWAFPMYAVRIENRNNEILLLHCVFELNKKHVFSVIENATYVVI
jgi:hypothetical protein